MITVDWLGPNPEMIVQKATPKGTELGKDEIVRTVRHAEVTRVSWTFQKKLLLLFESISSMTSLNG